MAADSMLGPSAGEQLQHLCDACPPQRSSTIFEQGQLTLSGFSRSAMAVPSARNSGLLRISKCTLGSVQFLLSTCSTGKISWLLACILSPFWTAAQQ